jgi:hypothetical protein
MITYEKMSRKPQVANSLIGMPLAEFDKLYAEFETAHLQRESALQFTRRHKLQRQRAVGAGRKHKHALRDRLLMTLFWLRAYTTYEVLGFFFKMGKTTVEDNMKNVLDTLAGITSFNFEHPQAEIPRLNSVHEVMEAFPEIHMMMDTKE